MPICPKCGKLIAPKKYKRHLQRCGKVHKHGPRPMPSGQDDYYMRM